MVMEHVKNFLKVYELNLDYELEHKSENDGIKLFYTKKSHYSILLPNKKIIYKARGTSISDNPTLMKVAENELLGSKNSISVKGTKTRLTTINDYKKSVMKSTVDPSHSVLYPGYSVIEETTFRFDGLDLPYSTLEEYQRRQKQNTDVGYLIENNDFGTIFKRRNDNYVKNRLN